MLPYFVFDHFNLGSITVHVWGLMVGLGFTAGYFLLLSLAKQKNLPQEKIFRLALVIFIGAVLGSRLAFLLQTPQKLLADISMFWSIDIGAIFLGGVLGAIIFGALYIKKEKLNLWVIADLLVLPLAIGMGIGRIGCFLINDHQGAPTSLPWAILWPDGIMRHPVALYESLAGFILFFIFWRLKNRFQNPGQLALVFLAVLSVVKFCLDFFRVQQGIYSDWHLGPLNTSQWLAILMFLAAIFFWRQRKKAN